jgi:hypothetical protein
VEARFLKQLKAHNGPLYALAAGRTSDTIFSAGADRVVAEWDVHLGTVLPFSIRTESTVLSLLHLNQSRLLIGTINGGMHVVDLAARKEIRHLKFHDKGIFHLASHSSLPRVYACSADGSLTIWDNEQWSLLWKLDLSEKKLRRIAFDASGELAAIASGDGLIHIIETAQNRLVYQWEAHEESANCVAFLPNGDLVSGGKDAYLRLWTKNNGYRLKHQVPAHNFAVYDILVHPNGDWLATASRDKTVKIWTPSLTEKPIRLDRKGSEGHLNSVNGLHYLDSRGWLASCSDDQSVVLWQVLSE